MDIEYKLAKTHDLQLISGATAPTNYGGGAAISANNASAATEAAKYGLHAVGVRPPLGKYIRSVIERREFLSFLAQSKAQAENQNTYLGQIWTVLTPLLNSLVYVLIFGMLLKTRHGMDSVIGYIVVGTFMYNLFSTSVSGSARSIQSNLKLVQSLNFPRALMPLSIVLKELFVLLPGFGVMFVLAELSILFTQDGGELHPERWILIVPATVLLAMFSAGCGMILAKFASRVPDILKLLPFVIRIGMYASGVIFAIQHTVEQSILQFILLHQPVAVFLNLARQAVLDESAIPLNWGLWLEGTIWAVAIFVIGFIAFWRDEARYGRD